MDHQELAEQQAHVDAAYREAAAKDFLVFARGLVIPSSVGPQMFDLCMTDFQRRCFEDLAPSLSAVRDARMPPKRRFWIERTKKSSKDQDIAVAILWLLAFAERPLLIQVCAADKDQAAIIRRRCVSTLYENEWLEELVSINRYVLSSRKSAAEAVIEATDLGGSHGETPDVLVLNELVHVAKWDVMENHMSNANGVPQGVVIIATNAGFKGTKAHVWRDNALKEEQWTTHIWSNPSPWTNKEDRLDEKRRLPRAKYSRLWHGVWSSGKGDAFDAADIDAIFDDKLKPLTKPQRGFLYLAGLDLGVSHDHSGLCVLGCHSQRRQIRVAQLFDFPVNARTGEVDLIEVQNACLAMHKTFNLRGLWYDPTQAKLMAQQLKRKNVPVMEYTFASPKHLSDMANSLKQAVESGILKSFPSDELFRDFGKFSIVEKLYGLRLEATSDEYGHADVGTALAITLPHALDMLGVKGILMKDDDITLSDDDDELSDDEIDTMPEELRAIYEG